jgi:hypothetical protein
LPIGVYRPDKGITPQRLIGHAEGFLKSDIIAQKWRLPVLGAASANFAASSEQWRVSLERLSAELKTKNILWFADAGSVKNQHVITQYQKAWKKLNEWGYSVLIVWYGQTDKSIGDADEISEEIKDSAQLITIDDYLGIAKQHGIHVEQNQTTEADSLDSTKYEANIQREPDLIQYEAYTQREDEQELIAEAEEERRDKIKKENLCNFIKSKIRNLKRFSNWKKTFEKSGKKLPTIPEAKNEIVYHPDKPLPRPEDYAIIRGLIDDDEIAPPKIIFKQGQRLEVLFKLKEAGWKYVFDSSFMGQGKSHDAGLFYPTESDENDETGIDEEGQPKNKVWYLDLNHTNPSTITVETMTNLQPRHDGMVEIENRFTPNGVAHLRRAKEGEVAVSPSNCINANIFIALQQKGYDINAYKEEVEDDNGKKVQRNKVCKNNCPFVGKCHNEVGNGYGYYYQRKKAFAANRIRASIDSMPTDSDSLSSDVAFVEEAASYLKGVESITASEKDINQIFTRIEKLDLELFEQLRPLRFALQSAFDGEFNEVVRGRNRGANHDALMGSLPSPQEIFNIEATSPEQANALLKEAKQTLWKRIYATIPTAKDIIEESDSVKGLGGKWRDAGALARRMMRAEAQNKTLETIENLPNNILENLIKVWLGLKPGALRVTGKTITVTTKSTRHAQILAGMKFVVLLDATGDKKHLAKVLDVDRNEIIEIAQETPDLNNLQVVNINMPGMGSRNVSDQCKERQKIFLNWVKETHWDVTSKALGYKNDKHLPIDGHWFHDNRATNAFKKTEIITVFNSPRMNLGVAQDEYRTMYGSLDGFEEYYRNLIKNEVIQLVGRQRAHLDPDCKYLIYLVGTKQNVSYLTEDFGIRVINKEMIEICPAAAKAGDQVLKAICDVAKNAEILAKLTTKQVADAIGKSKQLVSKTIKRVFGSWENFKRCLLSLLDLYRFGGQAKDWDALYDVDDAVVEELETLAHIYLPSVVKHDPPDEILEQISIIWKYGETAFNKLMTLLSSDVRQKLAQTMLVALGSEFLQEILGEFDEGIP